MYFSHQGPTTARPAQSQPANSKRTRSAPDFSEVRADACDSDAEKWPICRPRHASPLGQIPAPKPAAASFAGLEPGRVVLIDLSQSTRGKGAIREGRLVVWTHTIAEIVRHTRPAGPVDFTPRILVYLIACEASFMGTIPQAILRPQRKACSHRRPSMHDVR